VRPRGIGAEGTEVTSSFAATATSAWSVLPPAPASHIAAWPSAGWISRDTKVGEVTEYLVDERAPPIPSRGNSAGRGTTGSSTGHVWPHLVLLHRPHAEVGAPQPRLDRADAGRARAQARPVAP
jgi:hypothetical protein